MAKDKHNPLNKDTPEESKAPVQPEADVQADQEVMDSLVEDYLPPQKKPEEVKEPEAKPAEEKLETEEPAVELAPEPEPDKPPEKKYKYKGEELSLDDMIQRGLIDDVITQAQQVRHYQEQYENIKQQSEQARQALEQQQQQAEEQQPRGIPADQIFSAYQPQFGQVAEAGFVEGDFTELYPRTMSAMLYHRDLLYDTRKAVEELQKMVLGDHQERQATSAQQTIYQQIDSLSAKGKIYEPLKDPGVRQGFYDYIVEIDPKMNQLTPEFIDKQYFAYNSAIFADLKESPRTEPAGEKRRQAKGEGTTSRPGPVPKTEKTEEDETFDLLGVSDKLAQA